MSGYGLGGFAQGFLAGFDSMGQHFARRGTLQQQSDEMALRQKELEAHTRLAEANDQREADRWALERPKMEIENRVALATEKNRILDSDLSLEEKQRQIADLEALTQSRIANTAQTKATTNQININSGQIVADAKSHRALQNAQAGAATAAANESGVDTQAKLFELGEAKRKAEDKLSIGRAFTKMAAGLELDSKDQAAIRANPVFMDYVKDPNFTNHYEVVKNGVIASGQAGGDAAPLNTPPVLEAVGALMPNFFKSFVGRKEGDYQMTEVTPAGIHLTDDKNNLIFTAKQRIEPTPDYRQTVENKLRALDTRYAGQPNDPTYLKQKADLANTLEPQIVTGDLKDANGQPIRVPREKVMQFLTGLHAVANQIYNNPDLPNLARQIAANALELPGSGEPDSEKTFKRELEVREDTRKTGKEQRAIRKEQRAIRKEKLDRIDRIIMDRYKITDLANLTQSLGENGGRVQQERLLATRLLDEHPDWGEDQIMTEVARQLGEPKAAASARPKAGSPTSESVKRLWR